MPATARALAPPTPRAGGSAAPAAAQSDAPSQPMIKILLARGDAVLALGDVSAARLCYERAAGGGSARAALSAGKTYDPAFLAAINVQGMQPNPEAAATWY
ncbi:MAG: hypothetical protein M3Y41_07340, partial [Pseudomonadota bacterium]|nr:hypothetical protein [Pseudomonadota bacterium]